MGKTNHMDGNTVRDGDGAVVAIVVGNYDFGGRYFWHSVRPHGIGGIVLQKTWR